MAKLHDFYRESVVPGLMKEFSYNSVMQVPRIEKITLNMGVGEALADKKVLDNAVADLEAISGQKPIRTVARKSVAGFKVREGFPKSFDGRGNYSMGVREQIIFPEVDYDKVDKVRGLDITITTNAGTDDEARALLAAFNFPFRK